METELVNHFDTAILALKEKAKTLKNKGAIEAKIKKLEEQRPALTAALGEGDYDTANNILTSVIEMSAQIAEEKEKKPGFFSRLFGKKKAKPKAPTEPKKAVESKKLEPKKPEPKKPAKKPRKEKWLKPSTDDMLPESDDWLKPDPDDFRPKEAPKPSPEITAKPLTKKPTKKPSEKHVPVVVKVPAPIITAPTGEMKRMKVEMKRMHDEQDKEIKQLREELKQALSMQKELGAVQKRLQESDLALEGIMGAYSSLRKQVTSMRTNFSGNQPADTGHLAIEVRELKNQLDEMHNKMSNEMSFTKKAYSDFGIELLHVAVKLSELEHLISQGEKVTDVDIYSLKETMRLLEKRLGTIDARELKARHELMEEIKDKRSRMMRALQKKAVSKEDVESVSADVTYLKAQLNERQSRVSQKMDKEMHSRLGALDKKLTLIHGSLEKANKQGLKKAHDRINELTKEMNNVQMAELQMLQELEKQQAADTEMAKRLDSIHRQIRRKGVDFTDVRKALNILENDVKKRGGERAEELKTGLDATRRLLATMEES